MSDDASPGRVRVDSGSAFEALLSLAVVADPRWADTLSPGPGAVRAAVERGGPGFVADIRCLSRIGWINLLSLASRGRRARTIDNLLDTLRTGLPEEVAEVVLGGSRRQFHDLLDEDVLRAAVAGDRGAQRRIRIAFASGDTVLSATAWTLRSRPIAVRDLVTDVLVRWRDKVLDGSGEARLRQDLRISARHLRAEVRDLPRADVIARVAPGVRYDPDRSPGELLLLPTQVLAPVIVLVDDLRRTIVGVPSGAEGRPPDGVEIGAKALGDPRRLRILDELARGPLPAGDLAVVVGLPRTSLLHHLALLRAAGLIEVRVGVSDRTTYHLVPGAVGRLARDLSARWPD